MKGGVCILCRLRGRAGWGVGVGGVKGVMEDWVSVLCVDYVAG